MLSETFIMPDEGDRHSATWMAYGATIETWGTTSCYGASRLVARKDLIRIAANLSRFEQVKILVNGNDINEAKMFLSQVKNEIPNVETGGKLLPNIEAAGNIDFLKQPINDLWMRDTGPVYVLDHNRIPYAINFNFNGWGQKCTGARCWKKCPIKCANGVFDQRIKEDQQVANFIIQRTGVKRINTWLVMEGGGIEVNGKGTAICTESCILNPNRNPGKNKTDIEKELLRLLGIKKVIWLPGVKGNDITDAHIDFYARFVGETKIVCTLDNNQHSPDFQATHQNLQILSKATDANGNKLTVIPLVSPDFTKVEEAVNFRNGWNSRKSYFNEEGFAAGYVGFYLANNCVLMSMFGDSVTDNAAFNTISSIYHERTIMQITTDGIANGGGTIHCATQQQI